ncbi:hypothetical protein BH11MYX3_BH11MYX3_02800 [soil metagenome]
MKGITLDAGALLALENNDRRVVGLLATARRHGLELSVPAGVVAQVWRDGRRQARLARFLASDEVTVEVLDEPRARVAGQLCGIRGTSDVVDASVVISARANRHQVVTSDPRDLLRLDANLDLIVV